MRDPVGQILAYNRRFAGRYPLLLRRKLALLSESPFLFFRGTFHLFAADWADGRFDAWPEASAIRAREIRICADIHSENFGAYGGEHHTTLYGINDFDDATTGRLDFDACRCAASLLLAAARRGILPRSGAAGAHAFVEAYTGVLSGGPFPRNPGPIRALLHEAEESRRPDFIRARTVKRAGGRRFRGGRYFPLRPGHRAQALRLLADFLRRRGGTADREPGFFDVEDVAGRIAGCGSLGRLRYVVLVKGDAPDEDRHAILEFKESLPSPLDDARGRRPGRRAQLGRADDVVSATRAFQEKSDPFLGSAVDGDRSFQVRQLGPRNLRLDGDALTAGHEFRETAACYGAHLAAAHRRANPGAAARLFKEAAQGRPESFLRRTMSFALAYAEQAEDDWRAFRSRRPELARTLTT